MLSKKIKLILVSAILLTFFSIGVKAQSKCCNKQIQCSESSKKDKVYDNHIKRLDKSTTQAVISISAQCGMCKKRVEKTLMYERGVKKALVDVEKKEVLVVYKSNKTNLQKLREAIVAVGHDADNMTANLEAYNKLPACCKKTTTIKCED